MTSVVSTAAKVQALICIVKDLLDIMRSFGQTVKLPCNHLPFLFHQWTRLF